MLFAPTKHNLNNVGGLKKSSNCRFNQQMQQQHHNHPEQQQQQQNQQEKKEQSSQENLKAQALAQKAHSDQQHHHHQFRGGVEQFGLQSHVQSHSASKTGSSDNQQQQQQQQDTDKVEEEKPTTNQQTTEQLTMEAISKIESATLAAYLAGEFNGHSQKLMMKKEQKQKQKNIDDKQSPTSNVVVDNVVGVDGDNDGLDNVVELCSMERPLNIDAGAFLELFKRISSVKLHMEALTLQPEGTKRMELLQNDIRPIFTVECQLSNDLIKNVQRYDMFHLMQFESEKFNSLTQCTRFGQEEKRQVQLTLNDDAKNNNIRPEDKPEFGRIHFIVWWREPGTCLNEMLGMGVLPLDELYAASVLEQCKTITIQRRKVHLANLYFKISLGVAAEEGVGAGVETVTETQTQMATETVTHTESELTTFDNNNIKTMINGGKAINSSSRRTSIADSIAKAADSSEMNEKGGSTNGRSNSNGNTSDRNKKNCQIETANFIAETTRVRLLRGFIYASEVRQLDLEENQDFLVCRRFWENELAVTSADIDNKFNYQEQFAVLNDDAFLRRVERQYLHLELWRRRASILTTANLTDGNENSIEDIRPLGIARLPLHQFFIAYRDMAITNHLCKGKFPVVSFDAWAPIFNSQSEAGRSSIGELRCVLAIGSEEQIAKFKETNGYTDHMISDCPKPEVDKALFLQRPFAQMPSEADEQPPTSAAAALAQQQQQQQQHSKSNLLEFLQRSLSAQQPLSAAPPPPPRMPPETAAAASIAVETTASNVPLPSLLKPLQMPNVPASSFRFLLEIQRATGLPRNPGVRGKKSSKRNNNSSHQKQQRFPPNEPPSTYVTFQADEGCGPVYKSHEGDVYATNIVEKSIQPQWQQRFHISASIEYLLNPQKRFILKVWKKAATATATESHTQKRQQPTPLEDAIVGFAALDLNVFMRGLYLAGCFNIVDFNGRINGQLEVRSQPLEDVQKFMMMMMNRASMQMPPLGQHPHPHQHEQQQQSAMVASSLPPPLPPPTDDRRPRAGAGAMNLDNFIDDFDNALGLAHLNLGQAIKRKFNELEGISQRLRTRLVDVTGEQLAPQFNASILDDWQADKDNNVIDDGGDQFDDEFEHDINTIPDTPTSASLPLTEDDATQNDDSNARGPQLKISADVSADRIDASESMLPKE